MPSASTRNEGAAAMPGMLLPRAVSRYLQGAETVCTKAHPICKRTDRKRLQVACAQRQPLQHWAVIEVVSPAAVQRHEAPNRTVRAAEHPPALRDPLQLQSAVQTGTSKIWTVALFQPVAIVCVAGSNLS